MSGTAFGKGECTLCGIERPIHKDGRCYGCIAKAGIKAAVGIGRKRGRIKIPKPTDALPGSEEKIQILEQRAANGETLFHPNDPKMKGESLS